MSFRRAARAAGRMTRGPGLALAALALGGCDTIGDPLEQFGAGIPPPDEFQVMEYEPLVVPESYDLPEPRPGTPSPRAPQPERAAVATLLGPAAAEARAAEPSPGEQVLLSSADAASASSDIRVQLERERERAEASDEYEPPTIWELFGLGGGDDEGADVDESELIDPVAEAERLRTQGVATPVDPEAAARTEEEAEPEEEPMVFDRVPNNRIGPPPEPRF